MPTLPLGIDKPAMILFASECHFARCMLVELLSRKLKPTSIVLPGLQSLPAPLEVKPPPMNMPMAQAPASLTNMAHNSGIPVYRIGRPSRQMIEMLPGVQDRPVLLSVCYPRLIPESSVELFAEALNVHPSLLPDLRGPDPMFWTFQRGTRIAGVTIHRLAPEYDAGAIVKQQQVDWIDGQTEHDLELRLAIVAAELLLAHLQSPAPGVEQDHSRATWAPVPEADDFRIQPDWSPQRVSDLTQGIGSRGVPIDPADDQ